MNRQKRARRRTGPIGRQPRAARLELRCVRIGDRCRMVSDVPGRAPLSDSVRRVNSFNDLVDARSRHPGLVCAWTAYPSPSGGSIAEPYSRMKSCHSCGVRSRPCSWRGIPGAPAAGSCDVPEMADDAWERLRGASESPASASLVGRVGSLFVFRGSRPIAALLRKERIRRQWLDLVGRRGGRRWLVGVGHGFSLPRGQAPTRPSGRRA
jgi:hypothetical protein